MVTPFSLFCFCAAVFSGTLSVHAQQYVEQGPDLSATGGPVALSGDGNTALVSGTMDGVTGVWVFTRDSAGNWKQQAKLGAGGSVALSSDGNTALVGDPTDGGVGNDGVQGGTGQVFTRDSDGNWQRQGDKLTGAGAMSTSQAFFQGSSVALSADGNTALVSSPGDNGDIGAVWVFTRDSIGDWHQQGDKLVGSGATGTPNQGISLALSADGSTALVGGPSDGQKSGDFGPRPGAAWVFVRDGDGNWQQERDKLVGSDAVTLSSQYSYTGQGGSVSLSSDGNTAVWGAQGDADRGAAWVFTRDSHGIWQQQGTKLASIGGSSVSLSADGNTALLADNFRGVVILMRDRGGNWQQQGDSLVQQGENLNVALSADGSTALVSGGLDNFFVSVTRVFVRSPF